VVDVVSGLHHRPAAIGGVHPDKVTEHVVELDERRRVVRGLSNAFALDPDRINR